LTGFEIIVICFDQWSIPETVSETYIKVSINKFSHNICIILNREEAL